MEIKQVEQIGFRIRVRRSHECVLDPVARIILNFWQIAAYTSLTI